MTSAHADSPAAEPVTEKDDVITPDSAASTQWPQDDSSSIDRGPLPRDRKFGVGDVDIYARVAHAANGHSAQGLTELGTVGLDLHGLYGKEAGYAFGLGFDFGVGVDSSFIYGVRFLPLGWGVSLGHNGYLMLVGGIGVDGATSHIPASGIFPTQLLLALSVSSRVRIGFDAGITWAANSDRQNGARSLANGDELDVGTSLRVGEPCKCDSFTMSRGYFFRLDRKDQMGTNFIGFSIGLEIDGAG
ncbi:MAG: hypothetical protein ABI461_09195 [Polyangiaceae bacterium]